MHRKMASCSASFRFQLTLVLAVWFLFLAPVDPAIAGVNQSEEVRFLINFKEANPWQITAQLWDSWEETDATPCRWFGVSCTANSTVRQLDFSGWAINVVSLADLYNLRDLQMLDMSYNDIQVNIDEIGNFSGLTYLDLSETGLSGPVPPSISACQNLRFLALESNSFDALPPAMSDLVNLQFLSLANNSFSGPFPTEELQNLRSLVSLDLSTNSFNGSIPALSTLTNLLVLNLHNNNFTGFEQPSFIATQTLEQLSVSNNQIQGTIPSNVTNLLNLRVLDMSGNNFSGEIPPEISRLMNGSLTVLDLSRNQLTGQSPPDLLLQTLPTRYAFVNFSHNFLSGNIFSQKSQFFCFSGLDFSHNNFSGPIPSSIFNNPATVVFALLLNDNSFSGDIVDVLLGPGFQATTKARLQDNLFTGDLSRMANTSLTDVNLRLNEVDLSNNLLQWTTSQSIPDPITVTLKVLTSRTNLEEFSAGGNSFSGTSFPTACFLNSTSSVLRILDLSNSQLNGAIFASAFNSTCLPSIQILNLSNNHATGPLERIITNPQNAIVDVSNNDLSGPLPTIPRGSSMDNSKYFAGNPRLCGDPLPPCSHPGTGLQWWVLVIIIGGSVTIALGSCLFSTWRWSVYQKQHQQDADLIRTLLDRDAATLMSLRDLKKATSNFAGTAQIGQGGFGTVYMGRLNDGTIVAIKRSNREGSERDKQQFLNEVRILSHVNHRNLVKLLGCCMENKIALLVFEFVSNGTLQEHLKGKIGTVRLTWKQRLNIAVQTANAINYLHSAASFPIYHRDVKSANILLDDKLNAKVADFGISKLAPLQATHVSTVAIQGTMGYIDPEYYTSYQLTDKSDVYSFGVVLLELISAKPALDFARGGEETSLVYFATRYIERGELKRLIDPALRETYSEEGRNGRDSILSVGQLAMKCVDMRSKARPSMGEVYKELQNLWVELNSTLEHLEDSINENAYEDVEFDEEILLTTHRWKGSSSFVMQNDARDIQMSHLSGGRTS